MKFDFLMQRLNQGELNRLDIYFAEFVADLALTADAELINTFANLSHAQANQHCCLDISDSPLIQAKLRKLDCVTLVHPDDRQRVNTPLVMCSFKDVGHPLYCRLYLQRYYCYEINLTDALVQRNRQLNDGKEYVSILNELFPETSLDNKREIDWQKVAAFQSVTRQLTIITGGPGTGKTSTVVKILAALLSRLPDLSIKLAAPTGKAAARLNDSIKTALSTLPETISHLVPTEVSTVHRLLGMRADGRSYQFNQHNRMTADILVLDEISMIDVAMFNRLLNAISKETCLILLGDPDQLPSVDNGSILSDLAELGLDYDASFHQTVMTRLGIKLPKTLKPPHKLSGAFCHLRKSYRFSDNKGISHLAQAIRARQFKEPVSSEGVEFVTDYTRDLVVQDILDLYQSYLELTRTDATPGQLLVAFESCRVLSPVREGEFGVVALNAEMEAIIHPDIGNNPYYHGRPVIISKNDYNLGLFNGDTGICIRSGDGSFEVAFKGENGEVNSYLASRLPPFETSFVMTVHKAQGAEFDQVDLVLPLDLDGIEGLITRQLIYTAVTRAKSQLRVYAKASHLEASVHLDSSRLSGLVQCFKVISSETHGQSDQLGLFD